MLADALGRPLRVIVTAGQVGDITQAPMLLEGQGGDAVLADKAYDSNALRALIAAMGAEAVIPSNRTRKVIIPHDAGLYKYRNRIELLQPSQAFSPLRHPLRQTHRSLHGLRSPGRSHDLAALNVDPL
jgi:transposase